MKVGVFEILICLLTTAGCRGDSSGHEDPIPRDASLSPAKSQQSSAGTLVVEMTGRNFQWRVRYPGEDQLLHTQDDVLAWRDLHVPAHARVRIELVSDDLLYTFEIAEFEQNEIAVPDMEFFVEFQTGNPGQFDFRGDQFCGYAHPELSGTVFVETEQDLEKWLTKTRATEE